MSLLNERIYKPESYRYTIEQHNIANGASNNIDLILLNNEKLAILRSPLKTKYSSENIISAYYAKLFSTHVEQNVIPNFPILYFSMVENNLYSSIIEYANYDNLYNLLFDKSFSTYHLKSIIIQTFLTLHYMNNILKISHNDASLFNILIKKINPQYISYCVHHKKYININVEYLALISDFDKTRGNTQNYDNNYILKHYFSLCCQNIYKQHNIELTQNSIDMKRCLANDPVDVIYFKQLFDYMINVNKNRTKFDIVIFLISLLTYSIENFKDFVINIIDYYVYINKSIFFCIQKFLSNGISISKYKPHLIHNDNVYILYKHVFDANLLSYKNNVYLYNNLLKDVNVRGRFLDCFFIKQLKLYTILYKHDDIDNVINRVFDFKNRKITSHHRKQLLNWLFEKVIFDFNDDRKSIVINIIDRITQNYPLSIKYYQLLAIVVFYLCSYPEFNIQIETLLCIYKLKYSEVEFINMIYYICYTLSTY